METIKKYTPKIKKEKKEKRVKEISIELSQSRIQSYQINKYILDAIDSEGYGIVANTEEEKIKFLIETFKSEYCYPENLRYYGSYQKVFENWLMGLPSCFNIAFEYNKIIELGKEWGFLGEFPTSKKEDAFIKLWWSRIYMATQKIATKNNVSLK